MVNLLHYEHWTDKRKYFYVYWSILKIFFDKKIPYIPAFYHNNNITDSMEKARVYDNFFVEPCTITNHTCNLYYRFSFITIFQRSPCFTIAKMIKNLEPVKVHGHDMISFRMLKISGELILKQLEL